MLGDLLSVLRAMTKTTKTKRARKGPAKQSHCDLKEMAILVPLGLL